MRPCETRYALLVRLAWELRAIPATAVLVFPYYGEPVLYVPRRDGRAEPVLAAQRGGRWLLVWRGGELDAGRLGTAARRIAVEAAA
ncbi:hypothetical protein GCM10023085_69890 [Actinomadura viridis]|uniref:Uncharacterized protein n=1 Tax=Actinomadura viridis TaxID=58110 RepID=A0A931GRV8_9ACTN|nr:hypothetical protein [Actinomadura viridis]MBG6090154.1 hypothetical protein [Actinomadura viridis]